MLIRLTFMVVLRLFLLLSALLLLLLASMVPLLPLPQLYTTLTVTTAVHKRKTLVQCANFAPYLRSLSQLGSLLYDTVLVKMCYGP